MSREIHVRFCENLGLRCPGLLDNVLNPIFSMTAKEVQVINEENGEVEYMLSIKGNSFRRFSPRQLHGESE
jgi:hypothetical protein